MIGQQFGRWTVLAKAPVNRHNHIRWLCRCECGTERIVTQQSLRNGSSVSCGCFQRQAAAATCRRVRTKHGHNQKQKRSKEYTAWCNLIRRCETKSSSRHYCYGARGIRVCERWRASFEDFLADVGLAPSPKHSIGRIDNDRDYEPGNVTWQTMAEQMRNTSFNRWLTYNGRTMTIGDWAKELGINRRTIQARIDNYGWTAAEALSTPVSHRHSSK